MKPEARRIAIACGWTGVEWYEDNQGPPILHGFPPPTVGVDNKGDWEAKREQHTKHVPNYLGDLNAMHEAEKVLNLEQYEQYIDNLGVVLNKDPFFKIEAMRATISAAAPQRAEAFLRTIGKWVDDSEPVTA